MLITHVYEIGPESLAQVLEEGIHVVIVLEQDEILHPNFVSSMQGALHPRKCGRLEYPLALSLTQTLCRRSLLDTD